MDKYNSAFENENVSFDTDNLNVTVTPICSIDLQYMVKNIQYVPKNTRLELWTSKEKYCDAVELANKDNGTYIMNQKTNVIYKITDTEDNEVVFSELKDGDYIVLHESFLPQRQ